jgi:hypothetical protein
VTLVAVDWSGQPRGTVDVSGGNSPRISQSPDGSRLLIGNTVYASIGGVVGHLAGSDPTPVWGDDSSRLCGLKRTFVDPSANGGPSRVWLYNEAVGGSLWQVTELPMLQSDQSSWDIEQCDVSQGRITVLETGQDGVPVTLMTVGLNHGAVLARHDFAPNTIAMVSALSPDGRYLAGFQGGQSSPHPGVLDLQTGQFIAKLPRNVFPGQFTPDGSLMLCTTQSGSNPMVVATIDWRTGTQHWSETPASGATMLVYPAWTHGMRISGTSFAVAVAAPTAMSIVIITPEPHGEASDEVASGVGDLVGDR